VGKDAHPTQENRMKVDSLSSTELIELVHENALPFFQPIVGGESSVVSYEALGRLVFHGKVLTPNEFLPALVRAQVVQDFDFALLACVIKQVGAWTEGVGNTHVHVNASLETLRSLSYLHLVKELLKTHRVPPHCLTIEIVEGKSFWDDPEVCEVLRGLRQFGVALAIDDFPNWDDPSKLLAWLSNTPLRIRTLKFDRQFIQDLCRERVTGGPVTQAAFEYMAFAHHNGITCVAEGVETESDLAFAALLGFDRFQGNIVGQPESAHRAFHTILDLSLTSHVIHESISDRMRRARII